MTIAIRSVCAASRSFKRIHEKDKKQNAGDVNATVKLYDRLRPYATTDIKMNDLTALLRICRDIQTKELSQSTVHPKLEKSCTMGKALGVLYG